MKRAEAKVTQTGRDQCSWWECSIPSSHTVPAHSRGSTGTWRINVRVSQWAPAPERTEGALATCFALDLRFLPDLPFVPFSEWVLAYLFLVSHHEVDRAPGFLSSIQHTMNLATTLCRPEVISMCLETKRVSFASHICTREGLAKGRRNKLKKSFVHMVTIVNVYSCHSTSREIGSRTPNPRMLKPLR
jgi:hypothetical protein